jgi:phosphatidylglycerophosphatase A
MSDAPSAAPIRPTWRFMLRHPAHWMALGFGSGLSPKAPGTAGTLWAWLVYVLVDPYMSAPLWGATLVASTLIGWWACTVTARNLRTPDPGSIVWDEVVAFWLILWIVMPAPWWSQLIAFALFRFFDAVKRGPVGWADQLFKAERGAPIGWAQGFGILFDDFVAAGCTLFVMALVQRLV